MLNMFADAYANNEKAVADNAQAETQNFDDPEYGLVPNKPVYTQGVGGSKQYLSGLKSSLGEELAWNRRGSTSVSGVNGMIDIYDNPTTIHVSLTTLHDCLFLVSLATLSNLGLQDIQVRLLPAGIMYRHYIENTKMDIGSLGL